MKIPFSAQYIYRVPRAAEMSNHLARIDRLPKGIVPVKLPPRVKPHFCHALLSQLVVILYNAVTLIPFDSAIFVQDRSLAQQPLAKFGDPFLWPWRCLLFFSPPLPQTRDLFVKLNHIANASSCRRGADRRGV